jgi:hypothetical protein
LLLRNIEEWIYDEVDLLQTWSRRFFEQGTRRLNEKLVLKFSGC